MRREKTTSSAPRPAASIFRGRGPRGISHQYVLGIDRSRRSPFNGIRSTVFRDGSNFLGAQGQDRAREHSASGLLLAEESDTIGSCLIDESACAIA